MSSQALRHVAVDDAQRQAFDDGRLADAGLADQHRIVLGAARQHLDRAADFLVAADHRIELALARGFGQVAGIFLQRVIGVLGGCAMSAVRPLRRSSMAALSACGVTPALGEDLRGLGVLLQRERQQQALDGDVGVAGLLRDLLGVVEEPRRRGREIKLSGARARDFRQLGQRRLASAPAPRASCRPPRSIRPRGKPLPIVEQNLEQMLGRELLVALARAPATARSARSRARVRCISRNSFFPDLPMARLSMRSRAFSSEVDAGSREENASRQHDNSASAHPTADLTGDLGKAAPDW